MATKLQTKPDDNVKVWKYMMEDPNTQKSVTDITLQIPENSKFLNAGVQNGKVTLYFLIDADEKLVNRRFMVSGTGRDLPTEKIHYMATVEIMGEKMIGHVFEFDKEHVTQPSAPKKSDASYARDC